MAERTPRDLPSVVREDPVRRMNREYHDLLGWLVNPLEHRADRGRWQRRAPGVDLPFSFLGAPAAVVEHVRGDQEIPQETYADFRTRQTKLQMGAAQPNWMQLLLPNARIPQELLLFKHI